MRLDARVCLSVCELFSGVLRVLVFGVASACFVLPGDGGWDWAAWPRVDLCE